VTLGFIFLFRLGSLITIPGVVVSGEQANLDGSFYGILNLLGGGGLTMFSLFALGVTPYITASIIMQLLSSDVVPYFSRLKKRGESGRIKLEKITRLLTIGLAVLQGFAITISMEQVGIISFTGMFNGY
jgi:preprotein translocase subunit SecY